LAVLVLTLMVGGAAEPPPTRSTKPYYGEIDKGPLQFDRLTHYAWRTSSIGRAMPAVSPDGRRSAGYLNGLGLLISSGPEPDDVKVFPVNLGVALHIDLSGAIAFHWADDSRSVWTSTHGSGPRAGWATEPLRPMRARIDGSLSALPALRHANGPLDRLTWIGGRGLALAEFGTMGDYYRPPHSDAAPTLAFVDAARGKVLQEVRFDELDSDDPRRSLAPAGVRIRSAVTTLLPDGRAVALLQTRGWILWVQGQKPRRLPNPPDRAASIALDPKGLKVLVAEALPTQTICPRAPPCRVGPVVTGEVAALRDLATGRVIWSLQGVDQFGSGYTPVAISPDGRLALVGLPSMGPEVRIAVVAMSDGRVLQHLWGPFGTAYQIAFSPDGREVRVGVEGSIATYKVSSDRLRS
jgi:hypothetical protein